MSLICSILETTREGQVLAGTLTLGSDGQVTAEPSSPEYEFLMASILAETEARVDGKWITVEQDPERWLRALPSVFNGSYLRAGVEEKEG